MAKMIESKRVAEGTVSLLFKSGRFFIRGLFISGPSTKRDVEIAIKQPAEAIRNELFYETGSRSEQALAYIKEAWDHAILADARFE